MTKTLAIIASAVVLTSLTAVRPESGQPVLADFSAATFDNPLQIGNLHFPLVPGTTNRYHPRQGDRPGDG